MAHRKERERGRDEQVETKQITWGKKEEGYMGDQKTMMTEKEKKRVDKNSKIICNKL